MHRAERQIAQAKLARGHIETLQRSPCSVGAASEKIHQCSRFFGPDASRAFECHQRFFACRQGPAPPIQREPAPVGLQLDR